MKYFILALLLTSMVATIDLGAIKTELVNAVKAKATEVANCAKPKLIAAGKAAAANAIKGLLPSALGGILGRRLWWNPVKAAAGALKGAACKALGSSVTSKCTEFGQAGLGKVKGLLMKAPKVGSMIGQAWSAIKPCFDEQVAAGCAAAVKKVCGRRRRLFDFRAHLSKLVDAVKSKAGEIANCAKPKLIAAGKKAAADAINGLLPKALGMIMGRRLWWNPIKAAAGALKNAGCAALKGPATSKCNELGQAGLGKVKGYLAKVPKVGGLIAGAWTAIKPCFDEQVTAGCTAAVNKVCGRRN
jgi:hypothetical protein